MLEDIRAKQATNHSYHASFRFISYKRLETVERDDYPSFRAQCNYTEALRRTRHDELPSGKNLHVTNVVTMLREPKARMISAFLYGVHIAGFEHNMSDFEHMRKEMEVLKSNSNDSLSMNASLLQRAQIYANRSYIYGYQLRMIIGSLNFDLSKVNDYLHMPLVHKAISRLRDFFFVGIFEEYNKSIQVLHALSKV